MDDRYQMMNGFNGGWGVFMMLLQAIFLVIIVIAVLRLLRHHEIGVSRKADPLDVAKERYARGEIKKDEFEQLREDLK